MPRDDFSPDIKIRLAQRAGYLCSICSLMTVGPSSESPISVNLTGVAAHISGASSGPGSRRYDENLTPEDRSSIDNAIWLCTTHADLIDGDEETYTTECLKLIKQNHEARIKLKQSGINVDKGLIIKVELCNLAQITKHTELDFTERNILYGENGVGKTLICEFIAALTDRKHLERWTTRTRKVNGYFIIHFFKNQSNKFSISISSNNEVSYQFNEIEVPVLISPLSIFYLKENFDDFVNRSKKEKEYENFLDYFADYFGLTLNEFCNVIMALSKKRKYFVNDLGLNENKDELRIKIGSRRDSPVLSYNNLSGGERQRVIVEIALSTSSYYSLFNSTVLIIEQSAISTVDTSGINRLLEIIRKVNFNFQFFFTIADNIKRLKIEGFKTYCLEKTDTEVTISEHRQTS